MSDAEHRWEALLRKPYPCDHLLQVYADDTVLVGAIAHFVKSGLEQGEAAVVIATPAHRAALTRRLTDTGLRATKSLDQGALVALDAERCLAKLMAKGRPDRAAFRSVVMPILDRLRTAGYQKIRLFGEMVNLLWQHDAHEATIRLEELWNELVAEQGVCLLCAYRIDAAVTESRRGILHGIARLHSRSFGDADGLLLAAGEPLAPLRRRAPAQRQLRRVK